MKIVQINGTYGNADSTGRTTREMHEWLKAHGHQSVVYTASVNDGSGVDADVRFFSGKAGRNLHAIASRVTGLQGYFSVNSTHKLIHSLKKEKPDVVILRVLHNNTVNFPMLCRFLKQEDIVTVLVLHDCWYFTGHCCYYVSAGCEKWKASCGSCPQIRNWNKSLFFDFSSKHLKNKAKWFGSIPRLAVVGVSDWITNEARQSVLKTAADIRRIYNWIDLETFKPQNTKTLRAQLGIDEDTKVLLGVASGWSERKGLKELIMLAERLPQAKIIMIGNMPKDIALPQNVLAVGTVKDPKLLAQYYAVADVFVNPSVQETFGKTTAEAISCGTPVAAYETTACTELAGDSQCGVVVPCGNEEMFIAATKELLDAGKERYADICRKFAEENFSKDKNVQEYITLFKKLMRPV